MKNYVLLLLVILFTTISIQSQNGDCKSGDCKDGFGEFFDNTTKTSYSGYFKDSKFDGIGMYANNGILYYSNFTNGKIDGFAAYYENGHISSGNFTNNIKDGVHFINTDQANSLERKIVTYKNGEEVNTAFLKITNENISSGKECLSGNCTDGIGISFVRATSKLLIGTFKDTWFIEGEEYSLKDGSSDYYRNPWNPDTPYFSFSRIPTKDGGYIEFAAMNVFGKKQGQALTYLTKTKKLTNYIFKDGKIVNKE